MIGAVVLAAGAATRFGGPKQRLLLEDVLAAVRASTVEELVVVAGAYELETDARIVQCPDWRSGPGASLRCGLAALGRDVEAAVVVLADGPDLSPAAVDRIVGAWRSGAGAVLAASYGGVRGHPVLLARSAWATIPDEGARALVPTLVPCDDLGLPGDVDTPEDLPERLRDRPLPWAPVALAGVEEQAPAAGPRPARLTPVFVLGMSQRTGTNYLYDLFRLHPDTSLWAPRWEDHLLKHSGHLLSYASAVSRNWVPPLRNDPDERARLLRRLGDGLCLFLTDAANGKRAVTKAPSVQHLSRFFELFPDAYLVVLVRDGRSVSESLVRSWGFTHGIAARKWAAAARTVLDFDAANRAGGGRYRIVRYEDLVSDLETSFAAVLEFCDLDVSTYDFDAARDLPLRGSSTDRGGRADLHWDPVTRPKDFKGVERFESWSGRRHRQFNLAAADCLRALGYEPKAAGSPGPLLRARGLADDATWRLIQHRPFKTISWYRRRFRTRGSRRTEPDGVV